MALKKPIIGITSKVVNDPDYRIEVQGICAAYSQSVIEAGGIPFVIPLLAPSKASEIITSLDGLILSGGEDIDPALYGEERSPKLGAVSRKRDDFEIALFHEALSKKKPVLGICRGLQLINVALGGTLYQDIPSEMNTPISHTDEEDRWLELVHSVDIYPHSQLSNLIRSERIPVNSIHHQGIKKLGEGLTISATVPEDSLIEAIELKNEYPLIAVQWHPEVLWSSEKTKDAKQDALALFKWLVGASRS